MRWFPLSLLVTISVLALVRVFRSDQAAPISLLLPGKDSEMDNLLKDAVSSEQKDLAQQRSERSKMMQTIREKNSPLPLSKKDSESDLRLLKDAEAEQRLQHRKAEAKRQALDREAHKGNRQDSVSAQKLLKDAISEQHREDSRQTMAFKKDIQREVAGSVGGKAKKSAVDKELRMVLGPQFRLKHGGKKGVVKAPVSTSPEDRAALNKEEEKKLYSFLSKGQRIPHKIAFQSKDLDIKGKQDHPHLHHTGHETKKEIKEEKEEETLREATAWGARKAHLKPSDVHEPRAKRTRSSVATAANKYNSLGLGAGLNWHEASDRHAAHVKHRLHEARIIKEQQHEAISRHQAHELASNWDASESFRSMAQLTASRARALKLALAKTAQSVKPPNVSIPKNIGSLDKIMFN